MISPSHDFADPIDADDAPARAAAGFFLLDNADGRFNIDEQFGVISLAKEDCLSREFGSEHCARIRVIEASGESYELALRLRITGLIPQVVGAEETAFTARIQAETGQPASRSGLNWLRYAAAHGLMGPERLAQQLGAFGTVLEAGALYPSLTLEPGQLGLEGRIPYPSRADAAWTL